MRPIRMSMALAFSQGTGTHIVGNLQVGFDPFFLTGWFRNNSTTNPRLDTLYRVLSRVNDKSKANSSISGESDLRKPPDTSDPTSSEEEGTDHEINLITGSPIRFKMHFSSWHDDNTESSSNDEVDKTIAEMQHGSCLNFFANNFHRLAAFLSSSFFC